MSGGGHSRTGTSAFTRAAVPVELGRILSGLAGLMLLVVALPPFFDFPRLEYWLLPVGLIYLFLLLILPRFWLICLPIVTVGVDLTPMTGRFVYNEYDLFFLLTLASGLLYGRYRFKVMAPTPAVLLLLAYLLILLLGFRAWGVFLSPPEYAFENPYYQYEYGYKVLKGVLWGVTLVPMWGYLMAHDKQRSTDALITGLCGAALLLFVIILWERGTLFQILSWPAWYHVVNSFLDLTSSYRVTGLFADMHTGGEVIDGVILLLLPGTLYAAVYGKYVWLRLLGMASFLALAYVAMVGFTRTTYVAFALGTAIFCGVTVWLRRRAGAPLPVVLVPLLITATLSLIAAFVSYRYSGSYGLASFGLLLLLAFLASEWPLPHRFRHAPNLLALAIVGFAVSAHFSSRWAEASVLGALGMAVVLAGAYWAATGLFQRHTQLCRLDRLFLLGACVVLPVIATLALGGYQIGDRFSMAERDLESRENHWADVIASSGTSGWHWLLGNGVGAFPGAYITNHPAQVAHVGSFEVSPTYRDDILRLGSGRDLELGQRTVIVPYTNYLVKLKVRSSSKGRLVIGLCERNLLYASNFSPSCSRASVVVEPGETPEFQEIELQVHSGQVGEGAGVGRWPTLFTLQFAGRDALLDVDWIELSADGFNQLSNSAFIDGLDHWFYYNDFSHLPWHVKNLYLQAWFETGWLGLALLAALVGLLLYRGFKAKHAADSLIIVYISGVLTVCLFGVFGSPLDSARVAWLFYFFLASGLANLRVSHFRRRSRSRAGEGNLDPPAPQVSHPVQG